jgi:hypothetical protein
VLALHPPPPALCPRREHQDSDPETLALASAGSIQWEPAVGSWEDLGMGLLDSLNPMRVLLTQNSNAATDGEGQWGV